MCGRGLFCFNFGTEDSASQFIQPSGWSVDTRVSKYTHGCRYDPFSSVGAHILSLDAWKKCKSPFSQDLFCDLRVWKCNRNSLPRAKWACNLDGFYILGFIVCMSGVRTFCLLKYDLRRSSVNRQRGGCTSEVSQPLPGGWNWCCSHSNQSPRFNWFN